MIYNRMNQTKTCQPNAQVVKQLSPNTVIVSETQENIRTFVCRKCGASLKLKDLTRS